MDNYQLYEDPIGRGQHSIVYKSRYKKSVSFYAIKCIPKHLKATVTNQVRILNLLHHVNVMRFFSWYETNNHYWIILEYCTGGDLLSVLNSDKKLPESTVRVFGLDLINGLQHVHSNGFLYCDLKPSNILINGSGMLKLADFGLAQQIRILADEDIHMDPDAMMDPKQVIKAKRGTPCYMSPELFQGANHSICSDFWALGCVLYQMATGAPPFVSENGLGHLMEMIIHDEYEPLENVTEEFADLVNGLLRKDPAERYGWTELRNHSFFGGEVEQTAPKHDHYLETPSVFVKLSQIRKQLLSQNVSAPLEDDSHDLDEPLDEHQYSHDSARGGQHAVSNVSRHSAAPDAKGAPVSSINRRADAEVSQQQALRASVAQFAESKMERKHGPSYADGGVTRGAARSVTDVEYDFDQTAESTNDEITSEPDARSPREDASLYASEDESGYNEQEHGTEESDQHHHTVVDIRVAQKNHAQKENLVQEQGDTTQTASHRNTGGAPQSTTPRLVVPSSGSQQVTSQHASSGDPQQLTRAHEDSIAHTSTSPITSAQIQDLLFTHVDNYVKPIAHNPRIESVTPTKYNASTLSFTPLPLDQVLEMPQKQLENFLTVVYRSIGGKSTKSEKLNSLDYFEVLCKDTKSANLLINSSLMKLFIKMLKTNKTAAIRYKLCSVMGLLLRFATFISTDLIQAGIFEALIENTQHAHNKVCRKAAATLGELLFYVATQVPDPARPQNTWVVPHQVISCLIACTKPNKDEIVQHYAVKTMENICGHSKEFSHKFTCAESVSNLTHIFQHTQNDLLQCSALATLSRMSRHKTSMAEQLVSSLGPRTLLSILSQEKDSHLKLIQNALNIINLTLLHNPDSHSTRHLLELDSQKLTTSLLKLLDHSSVNIRSKAIMTSALVSRLDTEAVFRCCTDGKLCDKIERIVAKEKDSHAQQCISLLIDSLSELVVRVLKLTSSVLEDANKLRVSVSRNKCNSDLNVILIILTTPCLSQRAVSANVVQYLSTNLMLLKGVDTQTGSQLVQTLLSIVEVISQQYALSYHHQIVTEHLLPTLVQMLTSEDSDTRFLCLKIFTDILIRFLNDSSIYDVNHDEERGSCTQMLNQLIISQLLPLYDRLLVDIDPIPLYGLKLLNNIAEQNVGFISIVKENHLDVIPKLFEFFQLEHKNNNVHNVRLMLKVIASDVLPVEYIYEQNLIFKLISILDYSFENGIESFFEPSLGIVDCLLYKTSRLVQQCQANSQKETYLRDQANSMYSHNDQFIRLLPMFIQLCCHKDIAIAEASAHILLLLSRLYSQTHKEIFSDTHLLLIKNALMVYKESQADDSICQFLLKMIYMVVQHSPQLKQKMKDPELIAVIGKLASSTNTNCLQVASAVVEKLKE
mmetsp:Transcript_5487/g.20548  ORF Transcript_5487/g.20548 Transcript_5487/m.20548 type:complete len:1380 (+) Transcript_5487:324-4463(+)